jgi:anti-sigma factor RsiW
MSEQHDCGGDAAAYVLGALGQDEAEAFRGHMAGCIVCRDEVATLQQVADALPLAAAQFQAPAELRRRVLRGVAAEQRAGSTSAPRRRRRWSLALPRPALSAGLAGGLAAAVVAVVLITSGGSGSTHVFRASVGRAEVRVSGGHGELIIDRLPPPAAGQIYELWLKRGSSRPSPSTLFSVTSSGSSDVGVPGSLHGVNLLMVTSEPAGGTKAPTHTPVVVVPV